jgi:epoxyqueuosine reductase
MTKALLSEIIAHGDRGAVVPISHYDDLKREMEELKSENYHGFSDWMAGAMVIPNDLGFEPCSLISVVTPSPKVMVDFIYHGKPVHCIVPPQYSDEGVKDKEVLEYINAYLLPLGYRSALIYNLPQKLLAVHCGLGQYVRNNICFNDEFGSYIRVLSYISDVPYDRDGWLPIRRMDTCVQCRSCVTACPTKAIDPSQRIVNASICLTALNEVAGEFPDWLDTDAHNSLVGCMKCQDCCPGNAHNKNNIVKGFTFTEKETAELLSHQAGEPYSDLLAAKIEATVWISSGFSQLLPRNLAVLLENIYSESLM